MTKSTDIRTLKALDRPTRFTIPDTKGLHLWVRDDLKKYWVFRFTVNGNRHDTGLGSFPEITLADAKHKVAKLRGLLANGIKPLSSMAIGDDRLGYQYHIAEKLIHYGGQTFKSSYIVWDQSTNRSVTELLTPPKANKHNAVGVAKGFLADVLATRQQCRAPATKGKNKCRFHGGASTGPKTVAGRARCATAKTVHGFETRTTRIDRAVGMRRLRELEDLGHSLGIMCGPRMSGRKPK